MSELLYSNAAVLSWTFELLPSIPLGTGPYSYPYIPHTYNFEVCRTHTSLPTHGTSTCFPRKHIYVQLVTHRSALRLGFLRPASTCDDFK